MKLNFKAKRNIGLVVTTVVVIVAIILVVYFVQKSEVDGRLKSGSIGEIVSTSQADVCVKDLSIKQTFGELSAKQGKCFILLSIEITANKKLSVYSGSFEVKDAINVTACGYSSEDGRSVISDEVEYVLKKGESKTFNIYYEVQENRAESYYLYAFGAKIDLGGTVGNILR